jgi:23S rRNA pseudouridine2457 synthase
MTTLLFNKPFDVVTRFTLPDNAKPGQQTLGQYIQVPHVWPIGRLDRDSEGLLLLSTDTLVRSQLLDPQYRHPRSYLVQVEGVVSDDALQSMERGLVIDGKRTLSARAVHATPPPDLWPRNPPVRFRAAIPTSWLELTLTEGRNRQVRKMTAATGFPCLRLVRKSILHLDVFALGLGLGEFTTMSAEDERELRSALRQ